MILSHFFTRKYFIGIIILLIITLIIRTYAIHPTPPKTPITLSGTVALGLYEYNNSSATLLITNTQVYYLADKIPRNKEQIEEKYPGHNCYSILDCVTNKKVILKSVLKSEKRNIIKLIPKIVGINSENQNVTQLVPESRERDGRVQLISTESDGLDVYEVQEILF